MKKFFAFIFLLYVSFLINAQEFKYEAALQSVDSPGFYYIFLPPEITSKLNYKFSDIRIYDENNTQIPYIRLTNEDLYKTAKKIRLPILHSSHKKQKKYTLVLVHNPNKRNLTNLTLFIDNKEGEIWLNIMGSNDNKNWTILKNNARYQPEFSDSTVTEVRISDIPVSNFEYYRIIIYDFNQNVYNVHKVISYDIVPRKREYVEVPKPHFQQDDTTEPGHTILKITFDEPQYVDKFKFFISEPKLYLRKAELIKKDTSTGQKIRLKYYDRTQKDFYLCSDSTNEILLSRYFVKNVYLIVYNNDDKPLKFSDIRAYQLKEYLIAYLEPSHTYTLKFGNPNVPPPIYDLKFFSNKIPAVCPVVNITGIKNLINQEAGKKQIYIAPVYLWIALGIVVIILIAVSFVIFKKSKLNQDNDTSTEN